jgi:hypothetical protein
METVGIVPSLRDGALRDRDGLLLGRVEDVLFDAATHRPAWVVVRLSGEGGGGAGAGARRTLAPARGARARVDGMALTVDAVAVRSCPVVVTGPAPLRSDVAAAARHYGTRRFTERRTEAYTSVAPALAA